MFEHPRAKRGAKTIKPRACWAYIGNTHAPFFPALKSRIGHVRCDFRIYRIRDACAVDFGAYVIRAISPIPHNVAVSSQRFFVFGLGRAAWCIGRVEEALGAGDGGCLAHSGLVGGLCR